MAPPPPHTRLGRWWVRSRRTKAEQLAEERAFRHQVWVGEPRWWHRAWWVVADASDLAPVRGLLWAGFVYLLLTGPAALEHAGTGEDVVERAVVVSVRTSATEDVACDRLGLLPEPAEVVTYRVLRPADGRPGTVEVAGCPGGGEVPGDPVELVRYEGGEVSVDPFRSWSEVLLFAVVGWPPFSPALTAWVLATGYHWLAAERRAARQDDQRRGARPDQATP